MRNPWKEIKSPTKDVSALRANPNHPPDLFWAIDNIGRYLFIYEYPSNSDIIINDPPNLEGVEIVSMTTRSNTSRLILILKEKINWELFLALCNDLINSTMNIDLPQAASSTILQRLRRWNEFLKKKRLDILPEEKVKGLIGELLFLKRYLTIKYDICDAIDFWIGPEGCPQDFNINNTAIEVKCQSGGSDPIIKISSAEQLCSQLQHLFLYVVTLGKSSSNSKESLNLPMLISEIINDLETDSSHLNKFQDKLLAVGYYYSDKYLDYNYILTNEVIFKVTDNFPRICPNDLKHGITKLTYNISLSECIPFETNKSSLEF
ncbi:MAG: hypothetical protein SCALA702_00340 [Melioribacteraceae bacterium]|nr:MAG: hypothetical protein SCALA702_00340 [Melioribacteraceae bacterium]